MGLIPISIAIVTIGLSWVVVAIRKTGVTLTCRYHAPGLVLRYLDRPLAIITSLVHRLLEGAGDIQVVD